MSRYTLVVPVKGTALAKSRLDLDSETRLALARALAADTVEAALAAHEVATVIVVTSKEWSGLFRELGAVVVADRGAGLNAAVREGIQAAVNAGAERVAVLLGDVPALKPHELDEALALALSHERSFVADREGSGTVLLAAGALHDPAFGAGSAIAHKARGYVRLAIDAASGLRSDVDTLDQLAEIADRVGARSRSVVASVRSLLRPEEA